MPGNDFITAWQAQQPPPSFQFPFREHTYDFALRDFVRGSANCSMRLALADWNAANAAQNRMQHTLVIIFLVDDEADWPRAGELQDERIHPTDVIRHEKKPAGR